ncbi:hypothetical protein ACJJTC_011560 [Scirpophaga incertulas]
MLENKKGNPIGGIGKRGLFPLSIGIVFLTQLDFSASTIQTEINKAILALKQELSRELENIKKQNTERKVDIEKLSSEIEYIKKENEKLRSKILELKDTDITQPSSNTDSNKSKIVIYGVEEIHGEPECDIEHRILSAFHNILNVDLRGYIEDFHRIGRYQNKTRPLVIELISKRMVKYLLDNRHLFQGTTITILPYLDKKAQQKRKVMYEEMKSARQQGLHAIVRNNQLYIQGKRINLPDKKSEVSDALEEINNDKNTNQKNYSNNYSFRNYTNITY